MSDSLAALFMCHNPIHEIVTIHNCWGQEFKKSFTLQKKLGDIISNITSIPISVLL